MSDPLPEIDDIDIRALVTRLARPRVGGGYVIERAAIRAAGSNCAVVDAWILDHAGRLEQAAATTGGGLHRARRLDAADASNRAPRRFVLPPGALDAIHDASN
jgi:hypothetical protein